MKKRLETFGSASRVHVSFVLLYRNPRSCAPPVLSKPMTGTLLPITWAKICASLATGLRVVKFPLAYTKPGEVREAVRGTWPTIAP